MDRRNPEDNTEKFLDDYLLNRTLSKAAEGVGEPTVPESTPEEDDRMREMAAGLVAPFDTAVRPGEIRMLSHPDKPVFGVVLPWDSHSVLLVPFSGMKHPATDLEMYAEDGETRGAGMQVYQIWNARTVKKSVIGKSWICGSISEAEKARLNRMLRHSLLGEPLDDDLLPLIGMPLSGEDDIRRVYMKDDLALFDPLDRENDVRKQEMEFTVPEEMLKPADMIATDVPGWTFHPLWQNEDDGDTSPMIASRFADMLGAGLIAAFRPSKRNEDRKYALAAGKEKGIIHVNCRIEHREEILSLKYSPNEDTVWIHILAADMIHFSNALDGSEIIDAAEHVLGTIQDAKCIMKVEKGFNGSIAIRTPDGMICHLEVIP